MSHELQGSKSAQSLDVRLVNTRNETGFTVSDLTFLARDRQRRAATLVRPQKEGPVAAILYVHWYEPEACDSNRTQFFEEACTMAQRGVLSLLVETMWSDREWFLKRTQVDDVRMANEQVAELRTAMDLLLRQPQVDATRFAYVGHDFGAMFGVLAGSLDPRPTCYVLMAGAPRFSDWFLYYPRLEGEEREAFIRQMKPLDPIERVGSLSPAPVLFQFGKSDPHVPPDRAQAFLAAAMPPVEARWYEAGHGLNGQAQAERAAWVASLLGCPAN